MYIGKNAKATAKGSAAQASLEYLITTGFLLLVAGVFAFYALTSFGDNKNAALATDTAAKIASNSNLAASLGNGSQIYFDIQLPDTVQGITAYNQYVSVQYTSSAGNVNAYSYAKASITPAIIAVNPGKRTMSATFNDGNVILQ